MAVGRSTVENIFGKGENAADQHLSFSHNLFYPSPNKVQIVVWLRD